MPHPHRAAIGLGALLFIGGCSSSAAPPATTTISASLPTTSASAATAGTPSGPSSSAATASSSSSVPEPTSPVAAQDLSGELAVSTVTNDLEVPWGLGFLPDGTAVMSSRDDGTLSTIDPASGSVTAIGSIAGIEHGGEGGLLGVAVSPSFAQDNLLYVYFTGSAGNQIDTVTLRDGSISDQQVLLDGIPKAGIHNGGRLLFGPDGLLYVGTGDAGNRPNAQDMTSLGGKILRLSPDGSPAPGNPNPDAPLVYSAGHRNVQGLAFDDQGRLWAAEFGQNTWDELNLIVPGGNYGWPEVEGKQAADGFIEPEQVWSTADASPSGIASWRGSIWMAGLRGERLWQIPISDTAVAGAGGTDDASTGTNDVSVPSNVGVPSDIGEVTGEPVAHLAGSYGRLRTVAAAPDGSLWVSTSNTDGRGDIRDADDRILRIAAS